MEFENSSNDIQKLYYNLKDNSKNGCKNFAILKLAIEDETLIANYTDRIEKHNAQFMENILADSGFDVLVPKSVIFKKLFSSIFIDMNIKTEMFFCEVNTDSINPCAFNVHPRSSISKTPLMLANHTGIIDSGYRGSLIGAFRCLPYFQNDLAVEYTVIANTRLLQICHPTLCPIYVTIVNANDLSNSVRGDGGFGSTK
jgi:dUTP pyrophosphatase